MSRKIEFTEEQIQNVIEMYNTDKTIPEIQQYLQTSRQTTNRLLKRLRTDGVIGGRYGEKTKKALLFIDEIIAMRNEGKTYQDIMAKYNLSKDVLIEVFHTQGIIDYMYVYTDEDREMCCQMYKDGSTIEEISSALGMCVQTISKWIKDEGIEIKRSPYAVDEHYFDVVDDQNKAYILGLWYADGCNYTDTYEIMIALQEEDGYILEKIRQLMKIERPLEFIDRHSKCDRHKNMYRLRIKNKHLSETLNNLGVVKAKSLILEFPEWIPEDLLPHFIRGYFDGDGHIDRQHKHYGMNIVGTSMFCRAVGKILEETLDVKCHYYKHKEWTDVTTQMDVHKKDMCKRVFDWMYQDANLYLTRKHDVYISKYCSEENINNTSTSVAS